MFHNVTRWAGAVVILAVLVMLVTLVIALNPGVLFNHHGSALLVLQHIMQQLVMHASAATNGAGRLRFRYTWLVAGVSEAEMADTFPLNHG